MPLTNIQVDKAKPEAKDRKLFDEKGLYMLVKSAGHKWWRLKYRFGGRADGKPGKAEKVLALGVYPEVSLKRAREKRDEARRLLADGIDPSAERKAAGETQRVAHLGTFELSPTNGSSGRAGARATARGIPAGLSSTSFLGSASTPWRT